MSMLLALAMLCTVCLVTIAFPVAADEGYGVLFEGLPAEGETTVSQNGVEYTSPVATEDGCISLTPINERIDTVLKFNANSSLVGTVTYSFYVTTGDPASSILIGMNNLDLDGHRMMLSGIGADKDYLIELVYDVNTAEYGIYVNGTKTSNLSYSPTVDTGITDVALAAYAPQAGILTINKVKVTYAAPPKTGYGTYFEGLPESGLTQNGVVFEAKVDTTGYGTITNDGTKMTLTTDNTTAWRALDAKLTYDVDSNMEGKVVYEWTVKTGSNVPNVYVQYFKQNGGSLQKN